MAQLVPLRVKIGLKPNGHHKYPDFNSLPANVRDDMDWSHLVDRCGGWHYDKVDGHGEGAHPDWWEGCLCVPEAFALAAEAAFPGEVEIVTEAEFAVFHDTRAHSREPDVQVDADTVAAIEAKARMAKRLHDAGLDTHPLVTEAARAKKLALQPTTEEDYLTTSDRNALDPAHPAVGVRVNHRKTWALAKARAGIEIKDVKAQRLADGGGGGR